MTVRVLPHVDFKTYHRIFVVHRLTDKVGVADAIAYELRQLGYDATAGAPTEMLPQTDLVVTYDDLWNWDINNYLVEVDLAVMLSHTEKIIAIGHYSKPTAVIDHAPAELIHALVVRMFRHA